MRFSSRSQNAKNALHGILPFKVGSPASGWQTGRLSGRERPQKVSLSTAPLASWALESDLF